MDVTDVILRDHTWFREQFVALYDLHGREPADVPALEAVWQPLAARLDVHAVAEEEIFYPHLLEKGEDPEDETLDAIGDHNDIRDAVHAAARTPTGGQAWWEAVDAARESNDEHMAEEEREGIANFRLHASSDLRERLGRQLEDYLDAHPTTKRVDTDDKDPECYVAEVESDLAPQGDTAGEVGQSLGIGSLKRARA